MPSFTLFTEARNEIDLIELLVLHGSQGRISVNSRFLIDSFIVGNSSAFVFVTWPISIAVGLRVFKETAHYLFMRIFVYQLLFMP